MSSQSATLILVAGGKGLRMGSAVPKQFLPLQGKPVIYYPIRTFLNVFPGGQVILVLPESHFSYANMLLQAFNHDVELTIVGGGETRYHSVKNGLQEASGGIVFVHDGVRPFVSETLFRECYRQALDNGSAIPAVAVTDSIRQWDGQKYKAIDRALLRSMQTPQTFDIALLKQAFEQPYQEAFTDEATMLEYMGTDPCFVEGSRDNIKITTPEDMVIAESILQRNNNGNI